MKNYTSEVSPDRKGIITSGLKAVSGNSDYIEFYDKNGEMVAACSNNGWTMYTTNAEASRQAEMCMIYNEAWGNAKRGIPMAGEESVNVDSP